MAQRKIIIEGGRPTNATLDMLYAQYEKTYNSAKARLEAKGYQMYLPKMRKRDFGVKFMAVLNTEQSKGTEWQSKGAMANSIIHKVIEEQKYEYSGIQAKSYQKALKSMYGLDAKLNDVRAGRIAQVEDLKDKLEEMNTYLKNHTVEEFRKAYPEEAKALEPYLEVAFGKMDGKQRQKLFGRAYFGSV